MFKQLGGILKKVGAPLLGAVAGGPVGIATQAISMIASAAGVDSDNEDEIIKAIEADPKIAVELKRIEATHRERLQELSLDAAKIEAEKEKTAQADRADARKRETDYVQKTGKRDWSQTILAWAIIAGFLGAVFVYILGYANKDSSDVVLVLIGNLGGMALAVITYHFGSSKGSSDKTAFQNLQSLKQGGKNV